MSSLLFQAGCGVSPAGLRYVFRRCNEAVLVDVAGAVFVHFGHRYAHNELGFGVLMQ